MNTSPDFESIKQINIVGIEYWSARDLMKMLEYEYWQNFEKVIQKAITVCRIAQQNVQAHFIVTNKSVFLGYGSKREIIDYNLTRYALHLILILSDVKKPMIARALAYFTLKSLHGSKNYFPQDLSISIPSDIPITKEQKTIGQIRRSFSHLRAIQQYAVPPYRIDLYFPDYKVAIECDEYGHRKYEKENEYKRQKYLEHELNCRFIRYNPDDAKFNIGDVIHQIMMVVYENKNGLESDNAVSDILVSL